MRSIPSNFAERYGVDQLRYFFLREIHWSGRQFIRNEA